MDRTRNANPTTPVSFNYKLSDLFEPTNILCRMDGVLGAVNGHVDVIDEKEIAVADQTEDGGEGEEVEETVSIRRVDMDEEIPMDDLDEDSKMLVEELKRLMKNNQTTRGGTKQKPSKKDMTS